ncbi:MULTISPECIES: UDP-3-O-acyl-N-acetylglucosamine deacetylase [Asticcacaulis]|uniref:UDP-3-O-acyl-N-acetylglucosamine deacetylase n=1 Tax=Asticcacaulis endophyticus TaxID=1395890 RepID=A0A918US71_9CAUL|nr:MULTISPECIES: UDP-3-O-acyl-N-acetylglucosamine deacetylase [Asticcacaulis]WAC49556.1 UDP-3-O-acyl-N-acetylglucosamine deacetylase [Asticcacaulis sp. SL142]GGZ29724.1 UDP-3-O-acyl-N-acetylglucosamine deacetylase [Asticcacaulis endophyticus]
MLPEHHEHTLATPAICAGVGLHTGERVRLSVRPAPAGSGVVFMRSDITDRDNIIAATAESVTQTRLGTVITNKAGVSVSTIEHLMAALSALGVDNVLIEMDGPEVPIMDGSALPFVQLLDRAGFRRQPMPQSVIEILKPVHVIEGDKRASLLPCDRFEMRFEIEFDSAVIGHQVVDLVVTEDSFRDELMSARTFGFLEGVEALRAAGLARGGSMDNAIVIDGDKVLNAEGLRYTDEFVRHKALDAIGDLYVLGMPILGRFEGIKAGHGLNNALVRALLSRPDAYQVVTLAPALSKAG